MKLENEKFHQGLTVALLALLLLALTAADLVKPDRLFSKTEYWPRSRKAVWKTF